MLLVGQSLRRPTNLSTVKMERETPVVAFRVELLCPEHNVVMKAIKRYPESTVYKCPQCACRISRRINYPHIIYKEITK